MILERYIKLEKVIILVLSVLRMFTLRCYLFIYLNIYFLYFGRYVRVTTLYRCVCHPVCVSPVVIQQSSLRLIQSRQQRLLQLTQTQHELS